MKRKSKARTEQEVLASMSEQQLMGMIRDFQEADEPDPTQVYASQIATAELRRRKIIR